MKQKKPSVQKKSKNNREGWKQEFYREVEDIATHPMVLRMREYPHHGETSCYGHSMRVAYQNYILGKKLGLDARSAARGGLLHDLFLYDWHTCTKEQGNPVHGLTHPEVAYRNAKKYFDLGEVEADVIRSHMWPLTLWRVPCTKEGWLTVFTDKYCSLLETLRRNWSGRLSWKKKERL